MKIKIWLYIIVIGIGLIIVSISLGLIQEHLIAPTIESDLPIDSSLFYKADSIGLIKDKVLREISGMIASRKHPGHFWVHNDSGDSAKIYLINAAGKLIFQYKVPNASNIDWEDIAYMTIDSLHYLVIGDFGDNRSRRKHCTLYIFEEPDTINNRRGSLTGMIQYTYSNGPRDAEAMIVDPLSKDIYIFSKREKQIYLYTVPYPYHKDEIKALNPVSQLPHTQLVAADISQDGLNILLKDYNNIYYYRRKIGETVLECLQRKGVRIPYQRQPQGEAICWSPDGQSILSTSEFSSQRVVPVLYRWRRK